MFEAFWQGRLIPGARIDSLPFVEVRIICCVHPLHTLHCIPSTACRTKHCMLALRSLQAGSSSKAAPS